MLIVEILVFLAKANDPIKHVKIALMSWIPIGLSNSRLNVNPHQNEVSHESVQSHRGLDWITGEAWDYTNWWTGHEANDLPSMREEDGQEDYLGYSHESLGHWNEDSNNEFFTSYGYFFEYEGIKPVPKPGKYCF